MSARSNFSPPPCLPSLRPFVSPLSPLLALCLLFCLLALTCSCCLACFPLLLYRWKLLSFTVLKRMRKRAATKDFVRRLIGSQSPKIWFRTSFGPRSHLVRTSLKLQPVKTQPGEVLERLCNGLLLGLLLLLLLLELLLLGKARFLGREPRDLWKGWKLRGRNQKHKKMTWKKKVDPISGVPWGSGWKGWLAWGRIYDRNHRNVTSITSKFVCWKCHETWVCHAADDCSDCSNRRKIHVQSHDKKTGRVLQNWLLFSFGWKAAVLLSMRVCQWRLPTFNMVLSPKEMVLNMWFAMARTHFTYFVCQTKDGVVLVCQ